MLRSSVLAILLLGSVASAKAFLPITSLFNEFVLQRAGVGADTGMSTLEFVKPEPREEGRGDRPDCLPRPDSGACVQYVAERTYSRSTDDLIAIGRACRGNYGDSCVKYMAERTYARSLSDVMALAEACRGNLSNECIGYVAERSYARSTSDLVLIAQACQDSELSCVKFIAEKSYARSLDDLLKIARECGGRS